MLRAALLSLLLVSIALAGDAAPRRYVNLEKNARGERRTLPAWKSYADMTACMERGIHRLDAGAGKQAFQGGSCDDGRAADLAHGTAVETLPRDDRCGPLVKVRIASGTAAGTIACVPGEQLSAELVP